MWPWSWEAPEPQPQRLLSELLFAFPVLPWTLPLGRGEAVGRRRMAHSSPARGPVASHWWQGRTLSVFLRVREHRVPLSAQPALRILMQSGGRCPTFSLISLSPGWCLEKGRAALAVPIWMLAPHCNAWSIPAPYKIFFCTNLVPHLLTCLVTDLEKSPGSCTEQICVSSKPLAPSCGELPVRIGCATARSRAVVGPNTPLQTPCVRMIKAKACLVSQNKSRANLFWNKKHAW